MSTIDREYIKATWQQLAQRNDWKLVDDEVMFLNIVVQELDTLVDRRQEDKRIRLAIQRTYSTLLYRDLRQRKERAAYELWLAFLRIALRDGHLQPEAEELAQEVVVQIFSRLNDLRMPQSLITWAFLIFRTVRRNYLEERQNNLSHQEDKIGDTNDPVDPADLTELIEHAQVSKELQRLLRERLSNDLEFLTIIRTIVFGDNPRDIARDLNLPLHRARLAKHRALHRLRQDDEFLQILRELANDESIANLPNEYIDNS